ncbi:selenocysteine-specific elongation factor [Cimex lectularius]|uniref:Tr-type G domain-containing protein n=1 Tax=Cimex lectularius TaxID=79782 RepID=A0A8I6R9K4_CIMLE|nr:selenocysteine-specific elongation factor [Cimex lectularius]
MTLNVNVGLMGHVDSGKTSLAKALSSVASTASFDKSPQSQERGITIDLGFSSFYVDARDYLADSDFQLLQFTLVDCPGHASLIKTVIGGAQIIDIIILVIDITKGVQTQTAECLVISEIINKPMLIVLNKIDLLPSEKQQSGIDKVVKKLQITLKSTPFSNASIVPTSAIRGQDDPKKEGFSELINKLCRMVKDVERPVNKPMLLSVDHCFIIKGKGTIMTGTMIQGQLELGNNIEIPALKEIKKVKSMQTFKKDVKKVQAGDRVGICVTQFDPKSLERGLICAPGYISPLFAVVIKMKKVTYYRNTISSGSKYHVSIGHETVIAKLTLFLELSEKAEFNLDKDYLFLDEYNDSEQRVCYALLQFEHSVLSPSNSLIIGSKLDMDVNAPSCRLVFHGISLFDVSDRNYETSLLPKLKLFKYKQKTGVVYKMNNSTDIIAKSLFKKETKMYNFTNLKITLSTGENGYIESTFGQGGKVRITIPEGLRQETEHILKKMSKCSDTTLNNESVKVFLRFKRYIYDRDKKIIQNE